MWQLPNDIITLLQEKGLSGDPSTWEFKLQQLSDERVFLWFENNVGVLVLDNDWRIASMSEVAFTDEDKHAMQACEVQATAEIEDIGGPVTLYIDGSMAWTDKNEMFHTANWMDGTTQEQIVYWCAKIKKQENAWLTKMFQGDKSLQRLRQTLEYWRDAFAEKQMDTLRI